MLAQLDQIDGVYWSFTNYSGTLIRLSLKPDADRDFIIVHAGRILGDDGPAVLLRPTEVGREEWRDVVHVGELTQIEWRTVRLRAATLAVGLFAIALAIVAWLVRRRRGARPTTSDQPSLL